MPSTVIASYHYYVETKVLRIIFVSGMVYDYKDVPEDAYLNFKSARSKGIFLNQHIKPNYLFSRVDE